CHAQLSGGMRPSGRLLPIWRRSRCCTCSPLRDGATGAPGPAARGCSFPCGDLLMVEVCRHDRPGAVRDSGQSGGVHALNTSRLLVLALLVAAEPSAYASPSAKVPAFAVQVE